jgi:hypothetical protein
MIEWLMILVGGVLGSSHCVGMCGGFALTLGSVQPSLAANLSRQLTYSLGRVFTYAAGGAMAGYGGWRLSSELRPLLDVQALLAIAAGVLLIVQGLFAAGVFRRALPVFGSGPCAGAASFAALLRSPGLGSVFAAGLLNGLLPCGLVYAYLALATSTGSLFEGLLTMTLFGLGTIPVMVLTGCSGTLVSLRFRRRLFHIAAWCMVLTGVLTLLRGLGALPFAGAAGTAGCPMCH